jgi:hypothetical protein
MKRREDGRTRAKKNSEADLRRQAFLEMPEVDISSHKEGGKPGVRLRSGGLTVPMLRALGVIAEPHAGHRDILVTGAPLAKLRDVYVDLAENTDDPWLHEQLVRRVATLGQLMKKKRPR